MGGANKADWNLRITEVSELPELPTEEVYSNYAFSVRAAENGFVRCFPNRTDGEWFYAAMTCDWDSGNVDVCYLPQERYSFATLEKCFSHVGFEEMLAARERLILHASLVATPMGGILFSGPSGIGKSTQAALWNRYEGSPVINGDRPILSKTDGIWFAHGSPYAGSSRCFLNESVPITAIVLLEQGDSCRLSAVDSAEAFRRLYSETVVNAWNGKFVLKICDLLTDLASSVPVYRLRCTPDKESVEFLKTALEKGRQRNESK